MVSNVGGQISGCAGVSQLPGLKNQCLTSRTYNVAIEMDPNTCPYHRKLRQIERLYIQRVNKSKHRKPKPRPKLQILCRGRKGKKKDPANRSVYDYPSDSSQEEVQILEHCSKI